MRRGGIYDAIHDAEMLATMATENPESSIAYEVYQRLEGEYQRIRNRDSVILLRESDFIRLETAGLLNHNVVYYTYPDGDITAITAHWEERHPKNEVTYFID